MSENVLKKIKDVYRKLDEIKGFLQDVFITSEEYSGKTIVWIMAERKSSKMLLFP